MYKNHFWIAFISIISILIAWYTIKTGILLYDYASLKNSTVAEVKKWTVQELSSSSYAPYAHYEFKHDGTIFSGADVVRTTNYMNHWAAEEALPEYAKKIWTVWYDPQNPHYSALQKKFPTKECVSVAILFGLLLYFFGLGYYVKNVSGKQQG